MQLKSNYQIKRYDLHAHTKYSDGALTFEESLYKRAKIADVLGFSDHYRYLIAESGKLDAYCNAFENLKRSLANDAECQNELKLGVEIFLADLQQAMKNIVSHPFEYIIIENFEYFSNQHEVMDAMKALISAFNEMGRDVDIILAHPNYEVWFGHLQREGGLGIENMLSFLTLNEIALEININTGYFFQKGNFIEALSDETDIIVEILKRHKVLVSIGSDCHAYEDELLNNFNLAYTYFLSQSKSFQ